MESSERSEMVALAFTLSDAISNLVVRARHLFYAIVLVGLRCPQCHGHLLMIGESRCRCESCGNVLDPTATFQECSSCGGRPVLRIRHYQCRKCGEEVRSRFVFDNLVFDDQYFREKMAESRQRKKEQHAENRLLHIRELSPALEPEALELGSVPGLAGALDGLVGTAEALLWVPFCRGFDLTRYQRHIQAFLRPIATPFDSIPPLEQDRRLDRIWRFVAIIFMAHAGTVEIIQCDGTILVSKVDPH